MKFSIKNLFNKCDQIRSFFRIWSHLVKKLLMEQSFVFFVQSYVSPGFVKITILYIDLIVNLTFFGTGSESIHLNMYLKIAAREYQFKIFVKSSKYIHL